MNGQNFTSGLSGDDGVHSAGPIHDFIMNQREQMLHDALKDEYEHPLQEAVRSYREAMRPPKHDLDVEFFAKTMGVVNESSPLKVARNPIDADGRWRHDAVLRNVRGLELGDTGKLTIYARGDKEEFPVEKAIDQLNALRRMLANDDPIMFYVSEEKQVRITDIYSHAFFKDAWAGLPFSLVLAYFDEDESK